jgi:hypothetical protein
MTAAGRLRTGHGAPHPPSQVRCGENPGHLRIPGDPILK